MGRRLWGCDVCQIVCPWNWEAEKEGDPAFSAGEGLRAATRAIPLLTMTNAQFRARFGRTAMGWRGKKTIQRNACICLGNIGDPRAVPRWPTGFTAIPSRSVRASAAWALGEIGGAEARRELERALRREQDPMVIGEIRDALDAAGKTAQA